MEHKTKKRYYNPNFIILTLVVLAMASGCSETARRINSSAYDLPSFSESSSTSDSGMGRKSPQELVTAGYVYLAAGNLPLARLHFTYALRRDPELSTADIGLGDISYQSGDYVSALNYYQKAMASRSEDNSSSWGFEDNHTSSLKTGKSSQKDLLQAMLGQIRSLRQLGKMNDAEGLIAKTLKMAPDDIRVLNEKAISHDLKGEEQLAAEIYQRIALMAPDQAAPFNNIGVNLLAQGKYPEAIINLNKAFILNEKDERIRNNLAMALALYGQEDQALKLFKKTVGEAGAWNNLGYLYMTQGRTEDAQRALQKALELNPKFYERAQENLDRLENTTLLPEQPSLDRQNM